MKDMTIGQYYPVKSPVHKMIPQVKLLIAVAYVVMLFFIPTLNGFLGKGGTTNEFIVLTSICYGICLLFILAAVFLSRVPLLAVVKSLRRIIFIIVFMSLITLFLYSGKRMDDSWYYKWWIFSVSKEGVVNMAVMSLRLIFIVVGPSLLTMATTPVELTVGIESLLKPLSLIGLPVHEYAIIMSLTLRLIPTLSEEMTKIMNAQKARCADFDSGNIFKKARALMPVLIPLFVSAFKRADELAEAMDSRCYHGAKGRTRMKVPRFRLRDLLALLLFCMVFVLILFLRYNWLNLASIVLQLLGL